MSEHADTSVPLKYTVPDYPLSIQPCWCTGTDFRVLYRHDRWGQKLTSVVCRACGTVQLNPRMTEKQAESYYATLYPEGQHDAEKFFNEQRLLKAEALLEPFLDKNWAVLDYGCGPGGKLFGLKEKGFNIYGSDLNPAYTEYARKRGILPMDSRLFYDAIYLSHTVEHWMSPLAQLRALFQDRFKDKGRVFVEIPLLNRLLLGSRKDGIRGDVYFVHTWYFSVGALDKLFAQLGCRRVHTNWATFCVYDYAPAAAAPVRPTPVSDALLRIGISIFSKPVLRSAAYRLNRAIKVIEA